MTGTSRRKHPLEQACRRLTDFRRTGSGAHAIAEENIILAAGSRKPQRPVPIGRIPSSGAYSNFRMEFLPLSPGSGQLI